jgi:hypothetical protein
MCVRSIDVGRKQLWTPVNSLIRDGVDASSESALETFIQYAP